MFVFNLVSKLKIFKFMFNTADKLNNTTLN